MKKRLCIFWGKEIKRSWVFKVFVYGLVVGSLFVGKALSTVSVLALSYSQAVDVSFELNPTLSISLSSADLLISELAPGSVADSNTITVGVSTNASFGYTLSANVGNDTKYDTRSLIRADDDTSEFASIATDATMSAITTDNAWGFSSKLTTDGASWANYSGLPLYSDTENTKTILETSSPQDANTVDFKIAAKAGNTITAGEYKNVINFIAVAKPEPTPAPIACEENKICYSKNALDTVEGTMGQQPNATANSSVTLLASNYSRTGYGFAGWNTAPDYSGTNYGPNEDVTMPSDMSNGLSLYAIWVKSAGIMQEWDGCAGLNKGDVTALTDARDNDTYAVAKLADGKCWMIENFRLDADSTRTEAQKSLSQGYGTSDVYGSFIGLADSESSNFSDSTVANSIYYIISQTGTASVGIGSSDYYRAYRMPRYNNSNTNNRAEAPSLNTNNIFSYGNYYTWHAAIADTTSYSSGDHSTTSLCPIGWRLPLGGKTVDEFSFGALSLALGGPDDGAQSNSRVVSAAFRRYPNNYLYNGTYNSWSVGNRGIYGSYWTSTARSASSSFQLDLGSTYVKPGTFENSKYFGLGIRCVLNS